MIRKQSKQTSNNSKRTCDSDSTNQDSPILKPDTATLLSPLDTIKSVFWNIRDLIRKANFGLDTYLASLKILQKMSFSGCHALCRVVAAAIVSIVGKVHEYRVPKYRELIIWGMQTFSEANILKTEGEILKGINFEVPILTSVASEEDLKA